MIRAKICLSAVVVLVAFLTFGFQNSSDHKVLFEKAKFTMETKGDLEGAIKLFEQILAEYPDQREFAAKSQLYIGLCYEKQGQSKAIKAYEQVVKNYPDQTELVSMARSRLTNLKAQSSDTVKATQFPADVPYLEGGTLSPDGKRMVGVSFEIGQNIAVMNVGEDKVKQITRFDWSDDGGWTHQPVWSPDGTEIAFQFGSWWDDKPIELRTTTLDGKQSTIYTCATGKAIYPLQWLPQGDLILCELYQNDPDTLGIVSVRDGKFRPLRQIPEGTFGSSSPDGKYIVFHEGKNGSRNLSVISTYEQLCKPLTEGPNDDVQPLWAPDGKHIVFLSHRHGGWALWGIEVDKDGNPKGHPFLIRDGMQNADLRNWTSSGLYYQNWIHSNDVFLMPVDSQTGSPMGKPRQIDYTPTGNNKRPAWSPDGKYLAFVSNDEDYPDQGYLVIMPTAEGKAKKFPFPTNNFLPQWFHCMRWRPDGRAVGFRWANNNGMQTFFSLDPVSGEWQSWPLSWDYDRRSRAEWTGDGKAIYISQIGLANKNPGIIERELETGEERYLYRSEHSEPIVFRDLVSSRDYSKLAILLGGNLVIIDVKTGKTLRTFSNARSWGAVAWSPDSRKLFLFHRGSQSRNIKIYSILSMEDGSEKTFELKENLPGRLSYSDWSPDGNHIAFSMRSGKYEVFLLSNIIQKKQQ